MSAFNIEELALKVQKGSKSDRERERAGDEGGGHARKFKIECARPNAAMLPVLNTLRE